MLADCNVIDFNLNIYSGNLRTYYGFECVNLHANRIHQASETLIPFALTLEDLEADNKPRGWGGGGGHFFIWPIGVCATEIGYGSQRLECQTGFTILLLCVLNRVPFCTGSLSKSVKTCDERSTFAIPIILYTKQNKPGVRK